MNDLHAWKPMVNREKDLSTGRTETASRDLLTPFDERACKNFVLWTQQR